MQIIYHDLYLQVYSSDPAAEPGRIESIMKELEGKYRFVKPEQATEKDLLRVHTLFHVESIKREPQLYRLACLAAGGAIKAAQLAVDGEPSFGLIRPPGHHASPDHCWGFCFFNNIAIALARMREEGKIKRAFILDFDLHFGDGTNNYFAGAETRYFQPAASSRELFISEIEQILNKGNDYDILAVSAGFDRHVDDWGRQLHTEDYRIIGQLLKKAAISNCQGRIFSVLEGGYNHNVLGKNVQAFLEGLD
jgi:acetoin utilization deacetylase AcuC-like enzyme